ncbi:hypothetical protein MNV49_003767 [Pseudohyphozyma bogoriensis]|nr:hypothetical protein MNV49_003767 [Pseudohyphozyma bogoriensis]
MASAEPLVSTRISLRWPPAPAFENTDTLVLTGRTGFFLDLRVFTTGPKVGQVDWGIVGEKEWVEDKDGGPPKAVFKPLLDSRSKLAPPGGEDVGSFEDLARGDCLETGEMFNPDAGWAVQPYEEVWRRLPQPKGLRVLILEEIGRRTWSGRFGAKQLAIGEVEGGFVAKRWEGGRVIVSVGAEEAGLLEIDDNLLNMAEKEGWKEGVVVVIRGKKYRVKENGGGIVKAHTSPVTPLLRPSRSFTEVHGVRMSFESLSDEDVGVRKLGLGASEKEVLMDKLEEQEGMGGESRAVEMNGAWRRFRGGYQTTGSSNSWKISSEAIAIGLTVVFKVVLSIEALVTLNGTQLLLPVACQIAIVFHSACLLGEVRKVDQNTSTRDAESGVIVLISSASILLAWIAWLCWRLREKFDWMVLRSIGADLRIRKVAVLKFLLYFIVTSTVPSLAEPTQSTGAKIYAVLASVALLVVTVVGVVAARRESRPAMMGVMVAGAAGLGWYCYKAAQLVTDKPDPTSSS